MSKHYLTAASRTHHFIIQSFLDLLLEKDFRRITVNDILKKAEISKGTFYKHFLDKYDLLTQTYHEFFVSIQDDLLCFQDQEKIIKTFNNIRLSYKVLMEAKDEHVSIRDDFRKDLVCYYRKKNGNTPDAEASYFANQAIWSLDYLSSLNRYITVEDLDSIFHTSRKLSFQLLGAI